MLITVEWLEKENACKEAIEWASPKLNGGKPLAECIAGMERADWLLWLLYHSGAVNLRQLVWLSLIGPRRVLRYAGSAAAESLDAITKTEIWVKNPTLAAGWAAGWAAGAAEAAGLAAGAAEAAGWAAAAAGAAGWAAEAAGWAAGRAAGWAAAAAGLAAGRAAEHRAICDEVRAELGKPSFKELKWPTRKMEP